MKLSLRSEYALLTLIHLARQPGIPAISVSIGDSQRIPTEMLNEILVTLVNARYLRLTKGNYRLAKPAGKIPVIDIIRLFDGALAPVEPIREKATNLPRWTRKRN
jgi:Rrf2 family transcriptional regulator, cysteine metabolism repressor